MTSILSSSPQQTQDIAAKLAICLDGGDVIELRSDLGGGKTTFVQGLARALGYTGPVTSPTFTLSQIYVLPHGKEIHHYDLYRLSEAGVVGSELAEDLSDEAVISVIEWAGLVKADLPSDRIVIEFEVTADDGRNLHVSGTGPRSIAKLEQTAL
jgi:tRNA threonylcarbamoyladenosine biosynthesis protein TsaE